MTCPPSSRTAISNVVRVRSEGFSKSIATKRPFNRLAAGACGPSGRSAFICMARSMQRSRSSASKSRTDRKSLYCRAAVEVGVTLGSVVGVDSHVLGAQIARPHGGGRRSGAEIDGDHEFGALQVFGRLGRCLVVRPSVAEEHDRSDLD